MVKSTAVGGRFERDRRTAAKQADMKSVFRPAAMTAVLFFLFGVPAARAADPPSITVAYQNGITYSAFVIIKAERWIETGFPGSQVAWKQLASGAAVRDGMIANQIQLGAVGQAPFLIGWGRGFDWRMIGGGPYLDSWLNTMDPKIRSLRDIKPGQQIAVPSPDSAQALWLRKASATAFNDPHALDTSMVSLGHPDAFAALTNGQIALDFTNPPFQVFEVERGAHTIYHSNDAFGPATTIAIVMTQQFATAYPAVAPKLLGYFNRAYELIRSDPGAAAKLVADADGHPEMAGQYKTMMTSPGTVWTAAPRGFMALAAFMHRIGLLDNAPTDVRQLELGAITATPGS